MATITVKGYSLLDACQQVDAGGVFGQPNRLVATQDVLEENNHRIQKAFACIPTINPRGLASGWRREWWPVDVLIVCCTVLVGDLQRLHPRQRRRMRGGTRQKRLLLRGGAAEGGGRQRSHERATARRLAGRLDWCIGWPARRGCANDGNGAFLVTVRCDFIVIS